MAYGVRSQKFLCCLPVRFGVFVLSFLGFLLFGILAAAFWVTLFDKNYHYDTREKITTIIFTVKETLFCIFALCGFIGAIKRSLSLVSSYTYLLGYALGVSIVVDIIQIVVLFTTSKSTLINDCINGSTDQSTINSCNQIQTIRYVALGLIIVLFILQLYQYIIFSRYVKQLEEENVSNLRMRSINLTQPFTDNQYRESTETLHGPYPGGKEYASV